MMPTPSSERGLAVYEHGGPAITNEVLFRTDRKGDVQNLRYGSIDRYKVPKYRSVGHGRLIGLDRRYKISSSSPTDRVVEDLSLDPSSKSPSFPLLLKHQPGDDIPVLKPELSGRDDFIEQRNFVSLGRKRRRLSSEERAREHDAVASPDSHSSYEPEDLAHDCGGDDNNEIPDVFEQFKNHPDNKKQIELRNGTDRDPQNVEAWLRLIDHQRDYYKLTSGNDRKALGSSQLRVVSDMKVSLYERAIASVKTIRAREKLILGLMQEGSKVWDTNRQVKEWNAVLAWTKSVHIWYEYLNFQQTSATAFSYDKTLGTYINMFKVVSDLDEGDRDFHSVYLILRLTTFMHEAGYPERAIAIWQSLLEYNFLSPPGGKHGIHEYEAFWDSECARIGEESAQGWHRGSNNEMPSRKDEPLATLQMESLFSDWGEAEWMRSTRDILPARTLDDTVDDDPFRVILFSDVKDFVFRVRTSESKSHLIQAVLKFCGLPASIDASELSRKWWVDPFVCDFTSDLRVGLLADVNVLFASSDSLLEVWNCTSEPQNSQILRKFAAYALKLLAENSSDDRMAEYLIALQLQSKPSNARKIAKSALKRRPNSLLLYNAFGLVEARSGKAEAADNVWTTALSMAGSLGSAEQRHKMVLWHSWVWELMEQRRYESVRHLLVEAVPLETVVVENLRNLVKKREGSMMQQLRAETYLRSQVSEALANNDELTVELTGLYAMLQYLSQDHKLEAALQVYQSTLSLLSKVHSLKDVERLHQLRARHAHFHATSSPHGYKPLQLIPLFQESHKMFPNNSMFFKILNLYSRRAGIIDRVRTINIKQEVGTGVMSCLYVVTKEMSGQTSLGSTVHSIRRAFTKATESDSMIRRCPAVWLCWIEWESSLVQAQKNPDLKSLRQVCLSALSCCPWVKNLYLQGFTKTQNSTLLTDKDLEQVCRSMSERGLRIRHDMTDLLDEKYANDS